MQILKYLLLAVFAVSVMACSSNHNSHGHSHDVIGGHAPHHDHSQDDVMLSYTLYAADLELFVEFPPLVAGQISPFAAHITQLSNYTPVSDGQLTVSLIRDNRGIRHTVDTPSSPGIFRPALQPREAGSYKLVFDYKSEGKNTTFEIDDITVYADAHDAAHASTGADGNDEITFLKEQAWKTDFKVEEIIPTTFYSIIHTSARVKSTPQSEITLNAQASGAVILQAVLGQSVKRGELLAVVSATGIDNNINILLAESRIALEKSRADYIRTKPLAQNQAISQKDFLEILSRYRQDSLRYNQIAIMVSDRGMKITSPIEGFVSNIRVSNGSFLEEGSPVITVKNDRGLLIEAYVNKSDHRRVRDIFDANFVLAGNDKAITLSEINGRVLANNPFVNEEMTRIPITFSGENNGLLMPGMFVEAFLKTGKKDNTIVVPLSSVIEQQGLHYVFVQTGGETFVKRQVNLAYNDGFHTEVLSGLVSGERVVTRGAIQLKLASMAGSLPLHGHTH